MPVDTLLESWLPELTAWRRDFHAHPELGYAEHRTSGLVAERLEAFGLEVTTGVGGTGVVGTLRNGAGNRAITLRADMDALPIEEANDVPYRSQNAGKMHACGHDGHTTTLLAAARYLAETRRFSGTIHFIFQPAEEGGAGAARMIEDGLFDRFPCDAVFGAHNDPGLPVGVVSATPGIVNAASDTLRVEIIGRGGHAARPHLAADPLLAAAQMVTALQNFVSRRMPPFESAVVSICEFHAGSAHNVIPHSASLTGTVRTLTPAIRDLAQDEITRMLEAMAPGFGVEARIDYERGYPPVENDPDMAVLAAEAASGLLGAASVRSDSPPTMGGEDFAYYGRERPACFLRFGQRAEAEDGSVVGGMPLHHPNYDFNDAILPIGAAVFAAIAERMLSR